MKPSKRSRAVATALVLLSLSGAWANAAGTYYRWIDESGTPVNSDRPPPVGTDYEVVSTSTNKMQQQATNSGAEPAVTTDKPAAAKAADSGPLVVENQTQKNPEYCATAKQNLSALNTSARIRVSDGNGNYRYIDEKEKESQRVVAEATIAQHCE